MGEKRVTPEEIVEMCRLYKKLGTYAAVGRKMGRSGATVSKYIQMKGAPLNMQLAVQQMLNQK